MSHLSIIVKPNRHFDVAVTDTEGIHLNDQFSRECVEETLRGLLERRTINFIGDPRDAQLEPLKFGPAELRFMPIDVGLSTESWGVDLVFTQPDGLEKMLHIGRFEKVVDTFESALDQEYREETAVQVTTEQLKK